MSAFPPDLLGSGAPSFVLPLLAKATLVLAAAGVLATGLRRASASARHLVWALALGALTALPLWSILLPRWNLPILPAPKAPAARDLSVSVKPSRPWPPASDPRVDLAATDQAWVPRASEWARAARVSPSFSEPGPVVSAQSMAPLQVVRPQPPAWPRWAATIWLAGMALGLFQFLAGTIVICRAIHRGHRVEGGDWLASLAEAAAQLGVGRKVELRRTDAVTVPVVWGWRRPVVLIPESSDGWPPEQRKAFLLHELAHVARQDCMAQAIAAVAHAVYWPHPLVWWAVRRLRAEAERACDDLVLVAGTEAPEYAQYLLNAARTLRGAGWLPSGSSAVVERTHLGDRLLALLDDGKNRRSVSWRAVAVACSVVVTLAAGLAALQPAARAAALKAVRAIVAPLVEDAVPKPAVKAPPTLAAKSDSALAGTVKGPDGKPVDGALVIAKPSREWTEPVTATTAADGRFRLALPAKTAGPWDVTVEAKGLAAATLERVTVGAPLTVTLEKGGVITGAVHDGTDGRPLAGVRVAALTPSGLRYALPWQPSVGVVEALTDREGRFRLEGVARGLFEVSARAAKYGGARRRNIRAGANVDLLLFPGASIAGTVRGVGDRPLVGAVVLAQRRTNYGWTQAGAETTDSRGAFVIAGVEPGSYLLMTRRPDLAPALTDIAVEALAEARVDIALGPGAPVLGRLVDDQDRPAAGKVVFEEMGGRALPKQLAESLKVETGPDGLFVLDRVPSGSHDLGITASGFAPRRLGIEVGPREKSVDLGKVPLERGLTVTGRVVDKAGAAIANAMLFAAPTTSATFAVYTSSPDPVPSGADGSFVIGGLEPGVHTVTASAPGYVTAGQQTDAGSEKPLRLVLVPAGTITGSVVDGQRHPVESFNVIAERSESGGNGYGAGNSKQVTAPDGRFAIDDLAEGTYVLRATAPEYAPGLVTGVKLTAGKTADAGVIRLGAAGVVRGSVVDTAGAPVAGAVIAVFTPSMSGARDRAEGQSDASGAFEIRGVSAGRVAVTATHPSYAQGRIAGLEVDPAKGPAEAKVVVSVGGRLQGSVRKRDGTPMTGVGLTVASRRPEEGDPSFPPLSTTVQNDGTFVIDHITPGPATVSLNAQPSPGVTMGVQTKDVVIAEGQTTLADFTSREMLVSGRVTRADAGMPGVRVTVRSLPFSMSMSGAGAGVPAPHPGPQFLTGVTQDDGSYELLLSGPGPAWAEVASLDGRVQYASRNVDVPDAETYTLDLKIGGATVAGVIVDKETGAGIPRANVRATTKKEDDSAGANAGADGRFAFELAPGDYKVSTSADQYAPADSELTVGESGASELRLELSRGLLLEGKVVDLSGQAVSRVGVLANTDSNGWARYANSMEDGSFRFEHLAPRPYTLGAGSPATGFAVRSGVSPGDKGIVLTLRPGGRIHLTVVDAGGAPVKDVGPSVLGVDGSKVSLPLSTGRTDAHGVVDFASPSGAVEVEARRGALVGKATVQVEAAATATGRVVLGPAPSP